VELLFVLVIAAAIGGLARYALPGRHAYGLFLLPAISLVVAAVVWVALTWAGLKFDGGWIWVAALGGAVVASVVGALLLWRLRDRIDAQRLHHLSGGRA
jgi:O-antigen/teichoic acid export membrane protein